MRKKTITINCGGCDFCSTAESGEFICSWGNGQPKLMQSPKGKKVIKCNLINKGAK